RAMVTQQPELSEGGRPVLSAPPGAQRGLGEKVLIAWNGSTEQARATALAMPLLERASRVTVLTVEGGTVPGPTGAQVARYLQRNGIPAEPITVSPEKKSTGEALL